MATFIIGFIGVCAFSSVTMAFTTLVDITNKDIKIGGKGKGKGGNNDAIESFIEELGK